MACFSAAFMRAMVAGGGATGAGKAGGPSTNMMSVGIRP